MKEIWKDIEGYEGRYQVSNLGNVRRLAYTFTAKNVHGGLSTYRLKEKPVNQFPNYKGYLSVALPKTDSKDHHHAFVHRLVALAFIPNPQNLPQVNHIDENKTNNRVDNLEWCTCKQNVNWGRWREKQSNAHKLKGAKAVAQFDKDGHLLAVYNSITIAETINGCKHISTVANGDRFTADGYVWRFVPNANPKKLYADFDEYIKPKA